MNDLEMLANMLERARLKRFTATAPYETPPDTQHFTYWKSPPGEENPYAQIMLHDGVVGTAVFEFDASGTITDVSVSGD